MSKNKIIIIAVLLIVVLVFLNYYRSEKEEEIVSDDIEQKLSEPNTVFEKVKIVIKETIHDSDLSFNKECQEMSGQYWCGGLVSGDCRVNFKISAASRTYGSWLDYWTLKLGEKNKKPGEEVFEEDFLNAKGFHNKVYRVGECSKGYEEISDKISIYSNEYDFVISYDSSGFCCSKISDISIRNIADVLITNINKYF